LLCLWERHLIMLFPILGPSSLPVVVTQPDERHTNKTSSVLQWYDRHSIQHLGQTKTKPLLTCLQWTSSSPCSL